MTQYAPLPPSPVERDVEVDHIIYSSTLLKVGLFRCPTWHQAFNSIGFATNHLLVFPRTSVIITQSGYAPVVANPNVVMLYNQNQEYHRDKLSEWGDICEFFIFDSQALLNIYRTVDPTVEARAERPFCRTHGPSTTHTYLQQRQVVQHILNTHQPNKLYVEETMLNVLAQTIAATHTYRQSAPSPRAATRRLHAELAHHVQLTLSAHFQNPPSLAQLATTLNTSPYHLCRIFRRHTGTTIHQYLNQIRLRVALSSITDGAVDLAHLALELGYVHHSHFTQAFRRTFGLTPRAWRKQVSHA